MKTFLVALALIGAAFAQQASQVTPQYEPSAATPGSHGPTFEVASVKLSPPDGGPGGAVRAKLLQDMMQNLLKVGSIPVSGKRVTMRNQSLVNLVAAAYRVTMSQISGPPWMAEQRFDVDAKIPDDASPGQVNEMLQALLAERFGLQLHSESRSQSGYTLVVGKSGPKLQASVPPASLPEVAGSEDVRKAKAVQMMKERQSQLSPGGRGSHLRGITTARLADALSSYVGGPVIDMTGLDGKYDVDLETSPPHLDQASGMDDPGLTIFESVARLGLKLEPRKVLVDTLVIDSVSKMPTEN